MLKRNIVCYFLILLVATFSGVASASAPPYASIVAFTQNYGNPNMNTLAVLNIINLTPWEIYVGSPPPNNNNIMNGFCGPLVTTPVQPLPKTVPSSAPVNSAWLKGVSGAANTSIAGSGSVVNNNFAFHSLQIGLTNPFSAWIQGNNGVDLTSQNNGQTQKYYNYYASTTKYSTVPIVINSSNGAQQNGKTVALNFMVTSSMGFATEAYYAWPDYAYSPALALGSGDGTNSYCWTNNAFNVSATGSPPYSKPLNVSQFLTIQAAQGANWKPVLTAGSSLQTPKFLNTGALMYPQFSTVAGGVTGVNGITYDLVAMLQSGDYAQCSLIFMAVPTGTAAQ